MNPSERTAIGDPPARGAMARRVVELSAGPSRADAVVVTCDSGEIALDAIETLLGEPGIARVVIVDNASRPGFVDRLRGLGSERMEILVQPRNTGFAAAVNLGVSRCRSPVVALVNPDCVVEPGAMAAILESFEACPRTAVAGGLLLDAAGREQEGARRELPTRRHAVARWMGLRGPAWRFNHAGRPMPAAPADVPAVSGAFMAVRRSALASVGGLDERFVLHFEDLDWCARFRAAGHRVVFVPQARAVHLKGTSSESRPLFACFHKHRSMVLFDRLHARSPWAIRTRWLFAAGVWSACGIAMAKELLAAAAGRRFRTRQASRSDEASASRIRGRDGDRRITAA